MNVYIANAAEAAYCPQSPHLLEQDMVEKHIFWVGGGGYNEDEYVLLNLLNGGNLDVFGITFVFL